MQKEAAMRAEAAVKKEEAMRAEAAVQKDAAVQKEAAVKKEAATQEEVAVQKDAGRQEEEAMRQKNVGAYLSIFMSLTLTLVLSLCLVLIEGARQNTIRLETECVVDIGVNSVLAEYHREALEQYNLLFVDSSYGTDYPSYYNTEAHLREYLDKNVSLQEELGILADNSFFQSVYMDLLALSFSEVKVTGVSLATDNNGYNFQKQAIQAAESDIGIGIIEEVMSWIEVVETHSLLDNRMEEELDAVEQQLNTLRGKRQLEDNTWITVEVENPISDITDDRRKGLLNWVADDIGEISEKVVDLDQYISSRRKRQQMNKGNIVSEEKLSFYEKLVFQEYLFRYAGNYLEIKENAQLDYQIEYLLFGTDSDTENLRKTAAAICGMREVANMIYLMGDSEKKELVSAASAVLAAALFIPEAAPVFEAVILLGWSCLESLQDIRILLEGGKVPLLKDTSSWNCSLENVFGGSAEGRGKDSVGLQYQDYLRLFMYFADTEDVTYRFMDVMEMDIRRTEGNENFRIDGCIDYLEVQVTAASDYGYTYHLKHAKGYR